MDPWLTIVGLHEDGLDGLTPAARAAVDQAEVLAGDARMLAMVPDDGRERLPWPKPLSKLFPDLEQCRPRKVVILASGDPLDHGVGALVVRAFPRGEWRILPAPSSFALARARMGWSDGETETLSIHNRPVAVLTGHLFDGVKLIVLARDGGSAAAVAALLTARGYGRSTITVLERMGGVAEARIEGIAQDWKHDGRTADLNTLAIECVAEPGACVLPRTGGLPDQLFQTDGLLTKCEVRAVTLAALAPLPGQVLWDVGAGSGSIGIEWLRLAPRGRAVAIERDQKRLPLIKANAEALGADRLEIISGSAPDALGIISAPFAPPDTVFIGGGIDTPGVFEACWRALKPGGRLVANSVSLEGQRILFGLHAAHGGEMLQIAIGRAGPLGSMTGWRPLMPVVQWTGIKV
ncbi:Precorrin-6Y C(5,15)-methyltransferase (decarboxylating) [uncultured Gammaproteobacteria bacterium]